MGICYLETLLLPWKVHVPNICIRGMTLDSRYLSPGDLFIAINGHQRDGRCYVFNAINKGVSAVISEPFQYMDAIELCYINNIPIIYIKDLGNYISWLSGMFYKFPSHLLDLVGVTGTNGKTTVSHLLCQWVHLLNEKSAVMGTIGNGIFNNIFPSMNTTSSAVEIQKMLLYFYQKGVTFVSMEVSSHSLVQNRVYDLYFRAGVFTNLSHDHLDYHGNMISYRNAKWRLFSELKVREYIINGDDLTGFQWLLKLFRGTAVTWYRKMPRNWPGKWLRIISVYYYNFGFDVFFDSTWGKGLIHSQLIGRYNVCNLLLALATLLTLDYPLSDLLQQSAQLKSVCGRMEIFRVLGSPTVVVDYAHTPSALKKILLEIKLYCSGKIWCVFGCGGNRDTKKRPIMGRIAEKYADNVIITDDNPRAEESYDIINEIKSGFINMQSDCIQVIPRREEAIKTVIFQARSVDWILVAGKGHENYQIIGDNYFVYSDQSIVKKVLGIEK